MTEERKELIVTGSNARALAGPYRLEIPTEGGVVELTGINGCGKTTTAQLIAAACGSGDKIPPTFGEKQSEVCVSDGVEQVTLELSATKTTLDGAPLIGLALDQGEALGVLIEPGVGQKAAADKRRFQALGKICPVQLDADSLAKLTGGLEVAAITIGRVTTTPLAAQLEVNGATLADVAGAIKDGMNETKRKLERDAKENEGVVKDQRKILDELGDDALENPGLSLEEAEAFLEDKIKAEGEADRQWAIREGAVKARVELKAILSERKAPDVDHAKALLEEQEGIQADMAIENTNLQNELRRVHEKLDASSIHLENQELIIKGLDTDLENAKKEMEDWERDQAAFKADLPGISEKDLEAVHDEVHAVRHEVTLARNHQLAMEASQKRDEHEAQCDKKTQEASKYRSAAKAIWKRTGDLLASQGLTNLILQNGRLAVIHEGKVHEYADLSTGLRATYAFMWVMDALKVKKGTGPIYLALDPPTWAAFDPYHKADVDLAAAEVGVTVFTERPTKGPLSADPFIPEEMESGNDS